jgi:LemA protein
VTRRIRSASSFSETAKAESLLRDTLKSLIAVAEAYPDLKANRNFLQLQAQLKDLEDGIESARRYYNAVVPDFNTAVEREPLCIAGRRRRVSSALVFGRDMG